MSPDLQRIKHIRDYCIAIAETIQRYGNSFDVYASDADYQRSVSFSILQIGELSAGLSPEYKQETATRVQWGPMKACETLWPTITVRWISPSFGKQLLLIFPPYCSSVTNK